jgi:hypothetical protein
VESKWRGTCNKGWDDSKEELIGVVGCDVSFTFGFQGLNESLKCISRGVQGVSRGRERDRKCFADSVASKIVLYTCSQRCK